MPRVTSKITSAASRPPGDSPDPERPVDLARLLRIPRIDTESAQPLSPDSRWLVFAANPNGHREIFIQPVSGGLLRQISAGPGAKSHSHWLPDSRRIAFVSDPTGAEEFTFSDGWPDYFEPSIELIDAGSPTSTLWRWQQCAPVRCRSNPRKP